MRKTTVYLSDDEADGLRRVAAESGVSQSDLIRRGISHLIGKPMSTRVFHSMGQGASGGNRSRRWTSQEVYDRAFGRR